MNVLASIFRDNRFRPEDVPKSEAKLFYEGERRRPYLERFFVLLILATIVATAVKIGEPVSNLQRTLTNGTNGEERSLPDLWVKWGQDGRHFWQAMDELVEMRGGLVEGQQ